MKKTTLFFAMALLAASPAMAQFETCAADATKLYHTSNAGWSQSEYYPIINIDAEQLTTEGTGLAAHSGTSGENTSATFSNGVFKTPVYNVDGSMNPVPTSVEWPVQFYMACLTPTFYNSAYTKIEAGKKPSASSANDAPCYYNNNEVKQSPIWNKKGFIELSRLAADAAAPDVSRHGYIMIPDLPQVERVQFSFSSTGWKRGFKLDIKHNDGEWEPLQWEASDVAASILPFSEQGYAFEVMINKQDDAASKVSLRWSIWDGDTIHANVTKDDGSTYSTSHTPLAQKQVARVHQIKIFSGVVPAEAPVLESATNNVFVNNITAHFNGSDIVLSETAAVTLYSADGRVSYQGTTDRISASQFNTGIYVLKMIDSEGTVSRAKIRL